MIVLTMHSDPETVRQALAAGAAGYLVKGAQSSDLVEAIRAVARGDRYLHSSVTGHGRRGFDPLVRGGHHQPARTRGPEPARVRPGAAQIARSLDISIHTVRRHLANLSDKLGIQGTNALTRYAIRHGLARAE